MEIKKKLTLNKTITFKNTKIKKINSVFYNVLDKKNKNKILLKQSSERLIFNHSQVVAEHVLDLKKQDIKYLCEIIELHQELNLKIKSKS